MTYLLTKSPESLSKNSYLCCVAEVDEGFKGVFGPGGGGYAGLSGLQEDLRDKGLGLCLRFGFWV